MAKKNQNNKHQTKPVNFMREIFKFDIIFH